MSKIVKERLIETSKKEKSYYLKTHKIKKLHVGCGKNILPGWLNCDINGPVYLDVKKNLPFFNDVFNYIFCEHLIEHLSLKKGVYFLGECFRVLKLGGVIRISTPNLFYIMLTYLDKNPFVSLSVALKRHANAKKRTITRCEFFNDKMRYWGHKFIYDKEKLRRIILDVGYKDVIECKFGKSCHEALKDIENHADVEWMKLAEPVILEAKK